MWFVDEGIERFKLYMDNHPDATVQQLLEELRNIQIMNSLQPSDRMVIYLGAVFSDNYVATNAVHVHKATLSALATGDIQQRQLIAAFEWLATVRYPTTAKSFAKLLMQLYDEELVEEEQFFNWHGDVIVNEYSAQRMGVTYDQLEALRETSRPFITWLQEAEEEGEEDDEEEDDEEEN